MLRTALRRPLSTHTRLIAVSCPVRRTFVMAAPPQAQGANSGSHLSVNGLRTLSSAAPVAKSGDSQGTSLAVPPTQPDRRHDSSDPKTPSIFSFFEKVTATWQYIVADMKTCQGVIIDPVLDYDPASGTISTKTADGLLSFIRAHNLSIVRILYVILLSTFLCKTLLMHRVQ